MNRKCLKCGAYIRERNVCRIVGESADALNVHGECGFYNNNKIKRKIMSEGNSGSTGIGFFGLLTIVFIVLKLTKVIDWSWWWVTAPAWGSAALILIVAVVVGTIQFLGYRKTKNL